MPTPLINGQSYSWSRIEFNILGATVAGITAIKYEDKQEMQNNFGAGNRPVSRGYGKIECEGSVTLEMAEVEALQSVSKTGRLQDIPEFDIIVAYVPESGPKRTHKLRNCRFKENKREIKTGDMTIEVEIPLMLSHIDWK
jgi:hypothetical protein